MNYSRYTVVLHPSGCRIVEGYGIPVQDIAGLMGARSLRDHGRAAGVAFFFKQWGDWAPMSTTEGIQKLPFGEYILPTPERPGFGFIRKGKSAAGRVLDGQEWNEVPRVGGAL